MRIVFLSDDFPPTSFGGAGISTYELALGMKNAGHDVFVVTTCRKESEAGESEYHGLTVFKIVSNYPGRWRAYVSLYNRPVVRQVEALLEQIQPDVVNLNNVHYHLSYHCLKVAKRYAKRVVITLRDTMSICYGKLETKRYLDHFDSRTTWRDHIQQAGKRWNPLRNFCIKTYLAYADTIVAISTSLQQALLQNGIAKVEVIYNGIDVSEWQVDADATRHFQETHALQNKKVLLFSGRLSASKGGTKALEALALILKEMPDTVLLVAGSVDEYARAMQEYAKTVGVDKHLIFTGWMGREEIKIAYAASDVVLMPSIYLDAFGRVNIEAMASRKPVIGTCYGGTPEIVVDGVTGYIVNPLHPQEIAEKTLELLKNPQKAEAFGNAGYERVITDFYLQDKVQEYLKVYDPLPSVAP
ncbi:glycosyltransferase family 1 protein [Candidatus Kaiserbacteria bacterium]|nr:glycosyltransferase family 1 protein [Candidatus Kaiserbacteria bacterium]